MSARNAPDRRSRGRRRRQYRKSTPVIRLRRNAFKIQRHASLIAERLTSWSASEDARIVDLLAECQRVRDAAFKVDEVLAALEAEGFVPPKRASNWSPQPGQHVRVVGPPRAKFKEVYSDILRDDPKMLDDMVVQKMMDSGEVVVQRGRRMLLVVRKTHLRAAV
jgi:hypothetical protein